MRNFDRLVTFYLLRTVLYSGLFDKVDGCAADRAIEGLGYGEEHIKAIGGMSNFLKELKKRHDDILKNMPKFLFIMIKIRLKKLLNAHIPCLHLALYLKKLLIKSYQKLFFFFGANHF